MSKQFRVALEPDLLKPVIEAMIFASEEPLSARALIRLLAGDRDGAREDAGASDAAADTEAAADVDAASNVDAVADPDGGVDEAAAESDEVAASDAAADVISADAEGDDAPAGVGGDAVDLAAAMEDAEARRNGKANAAAGLDQGLVRRMIAELNEDYDVTGRAFRIVEVAGGFQFATIREYGEYVALLSREKLRRRLSPAALETLAIIAYRQPVSKPEVESIRGVNCDQVLLSLMEKNLAAITGRSEGVGRPLLYGTTEDFLRCFGLKGIGDLPKLREIEELMEEGTYSAERAEVITVDANTDAEEIEARVGAAGHAAEDGSFDEAMIAGTIELVEGDAPDDEPADDAVDDEADEDEVDEEDAVDEEDEVNDEDAVDEEDEMDEEDEVDDDAADDADDDAADEDDGHKDDLSSDDEGEPVDAEDSDEEERDGEHAHAAAHDHEE